MSHVSEVPAAKGRRKRWPLVVALGALLALVLTAGWAGYRMLDPVAASMGSSVTCYSTGKLEAATGAITTAHLGLKQGETVTVHSIELLDAVNFRLVGTGVQRVVGGIGVAHYPARTEEADAQAAWLQRAELPAVLGGGTAESAILAFEPLEPGEESSFNAVRVAYRSQWGLPYSRDLAMRVEARSDCLLDGEGDG